MAWMSEVEAIMSNYGIPKYVWYPIMIMESGGNPAAYNARETATGLFQIRRDVHPQYANVNLADPVINAKIAARDFLSGAWQQAKNFQDPGMQAAITWKEGLKPAWNSQKQAQIENFARKMAKSDSLTPLVPGGRISQDNRSRYQKWIDRFTAKLKGVALPKGLATLNPETGQIEIYRVGGVDPKSKLQEIITLDSKGQNLDPTPKAQSKIISQILTSVKMGAIYIILILVAILAVYLSTKEGE